MAARCLLLVWVKSAKGIPQPRANVFQERGRCWGILPSGGAVLGIVPGHGGHRHRQDLRQPVLDGGDDLEEMKSGLSSQKGITMLRQHRTIPALRLKHRSGGCGTASALPKCSIMSGCGTRIVLRGQKPLAPCDRCPCFGSLFPPLAALTFAASSIICAFGLASAAPCSPYRHLELCGIALIHPPLFPFSPLLFFFIHPFCFPAFHLSAHLLFQQTCNKKRAHQVGGRGKSAYRIF